MDVFRKLPLYGAAPFALEKLEGLRIFNLFPNFHAAGLACKLALFLYYNCIQVSPPNGPLTPEMATTFHRDADVQASFLPPAILSAISKDAAAVESISRLSYVLYGRESNQETEHDDSYLQI